MIYNQYNKQQQPQSDYVSRVQTDKRSEATTAAARATSTERVSNGSSERGDAGEYTREYRTAAGMLEHAPVSESDSTQECAGDEENRARLEQGFSAPLPRGDEEGAQNRLGTDRSASQRGE